MSKQKLFLTLLGAGIFLLGCFINSPAQQPLNQQAASLGISPASIDTKVKSGASYTQTFTITNGTGVRLQFRCSVNDMWIDEKNNRLNGPAGTLPRSASPWIQFTPSEIIVEPHSSAVVKAVITVPQNVAGSFYAVPTFEGMPAEKYAVNQKVSTASIGIRFRALMMLTTEEGAEYNVEVMGGKISPPTSSSEMELSLDLRNRGTAHVRVRGAFALLDASGKLVGRGSIDAKRYLPTQRNFIQSRWAGELPPGKYICVATLSYDRVAAEPVSLVYEIPFAVK